MYTFPQRRSKTPTAASGRADGAAAQTAAATVQGKLDETLNNSDRVAAQRRLAGVLNLGPRAVTQARLVQMMSSPVPLSQASDGQGLTDEEELLQTRPAVQREAMLDDEDLVQPKANPVQRDHMADDEDLMQPKAPAVQRRAPNATGMSDSLKQGVEGLSGISLDSVRVHYNSSKPAQMQALAYAQGTDIHLAPGQQQHLPHEAWHVVQQMEGRVPVLRKFAGQPLNDDPALEGEADRMGQAAARFDAADASGDGVVAQRCGTDRRK